MTKVDVRTHWQGVYGSRNETEVSWFEQTPAVSFDLVRRSGVSKDAPIIDVGGGASRLAGNLMDHGYRAVTVLDVSSEALSVAQARLGPRAGEIRWIEADATKWEPDQSYALWHDRAAFHFLTDADDRRAYVERLIKALPQGGQAIIGTFALDGPERCSGLPVVRYSPESLGETLGDAFALEESRPFEHRTPSGGIQRFQFSRFRKL